MVKKKFVRKHVIKHHTKQHTPNQFKGVLPSAYGSSTSNVQPTAPGQFNPKGWDKQHASRSCAEFQR